MLHLKLYLVLAALISLFNIVQSSSHESLVKRTESGKPYYIRDVTRGEGKDTLYDQVARIVFEFETPNWTDPISLIDYTCTGDNYEIDGYSCPVLYYWLTQVRDVLQDDIFVNSLRIEDGASFNLNDGEDCASISQIFEGLYLGEEQRAAFYQAVNSTCEPGSTLRLPLSAKFKADNIDQPYKTMREKFFEEFYSLQTPVNRSNDAMYTNARYNFYSSGLFNYYVEARRWKDALSECKSRRLPSTLISLEDLQSALNELTTSYATPNGYQLFLSQDKISSYYRGSLELADCTLTKDSLIAVVHVPLLLTPPSGKTPPEKKNLEVIPVQVFSPGEKREICYLDEDLMSGGGSLMNHWAFSYDSESQMLLDADSTPQRRNSRSKALWPIKRTCAQALVTGRGEDDLCTWKCEPVGNFNLPIVRQVAGDRFLVVGDPTVITGGGEGLKVICPLYQKEEGIELPVSGALEVTLPCGCVLQHQTRVFKVGHSCGVELAKVSIPFVDTTLRNQ